MRRSGKVLLLSPQPFFSDRGTPIAVLHVLEALSESRIQVDVLTYPLGREVDLPGVRLFRCATPIRARQVPIGFSVRKVILDLGLAALLVKRLRAERYAYVHAVEESAFLAVLACRRFGIPVVYDMQSSLPDQMTKHRVFRGAAVQRLLRRCETWLLRRADVIACSKGLGARVQRLVPGAEVREWRFASRPVNVSADEAAAIRAELGLAAESRVVMYCGTFEPYQGLSGLLAVLPRVVAAAPTTVLVLVGAEARAHRRILRVADELGINGNLRVVERQPRHRIPAFLAVADVLVALRAYGENMPLKVYDYLAAGKPIVATRDMADSALLTPERAVLVERANDELAAALTTLLEDPDRQRRLGRAARAYAEESLGWAAFAQSVRELGAAARARGG